MKESKVVQARVPARPTDDELDQRLTNYLAKCKALEKLERKNKRGLKT